jgi:undecaprenyl-diphosphatase
MAVPIFSFMVLATGILMFLERAGAPVVLSLDFKSDLKRESRWFAQYGQAACTLVLAAVMWRLDSRRFPYGFWPPGLLMTAVFGTGLLCTLLKRLLGRVRPGREGAGRFLGPTMEHANYRESFPSSHSACAMAMTVILSTLYPAAAAIFWLMAFICATLRYLMDAHWPSDVLGGLALGYAVASLLTRIVLGA